MSKLVVLSLEWGDLYSGFPAVTARLWETGNVHPIKFVGQLPAAPEISELYRAWQSVYFALCQRLASVRIDVEAGGITNISEVEFDDLCQRLAEHINIWLNSELFRPINIQLRTHLSSSDEIRVLVETEDALLQRLPWHLWNFFEDYPKAEIAISASKYQRAAKRIKPKSTSRIRILAIFGNSKGIDLTQDRAFLDQLRTQAEIECLVEPSRSQLNDRLWQSWDMLFFAGHSSSQEKGLIQINSTDSLTLEQLRYGLQRAIAQGLKLAIFNSCDSLGLAQELADLHIPQVIVMREPVPDEVAHSFLKQFLMAFASGQSLYISVREGRERLQGLEDQYPCASWLPVIYQNPAETPLTWREWDGTTLDSIQTSSKPQASKLPRILLSSLMLATCVMGIRWLGLLQGWELQAFDLVMRSRPIESQDQRLLIVEVTEADLQLPEQQQRRGSLSDTALAKLLKKLEAFQPRAIGLDIYRDFPVDQSQRKLATWMQTQKGFFAVCKGRDSELNHPGVAPPPEVPLERQGFSDGVKDADEVLRRYLVGMEPESTSPCTASYALSAQLAFYYLEAEGISAQYSPSGDLQIGQVNLKQLKSHQGGYQRFDQRGYQILLNYRSRSSPRDIAPILSLSDVLNDKVKPDRIKSLRDRVILIGVTAPSVHDYHLTPYSARQDHQQTPGVVVQAHMVSQILSAVQDNRPLLNGWSFENEFGWIWIWAVVGGLLAYRFRSPLVLVLAGGTTIGVLYGFCLFLFVQGRWVPLVPAGLAFVGAIGSTLMIYRFPAGERNTT